MRRFSFLRHVQQMAKNKNSNNYDRVTESKLLIQDKLDQSSLFENKLILSGEIFSDSSCVTQVSNFVLQNQR